MEDTFNALETARKHAYTHTHTDSHTRMRWKLVYLFKCGTWCTAWRHSFRWCVLNKMRSRGVILTVHWQVPTCSAVGNEDTALFMIVIKTAIPLVGLAI